MILLPTMSGPQSASWHGVMDLHVHLAYGWTIIGGQLVHLHCAERGFAPSRPTDDVDTVIDVRARADREVMLGLDGAAESLDRLARAARLT